MVRCVACRVHPHFSQAGCQVPANKDEVEGERRVGPLNLVIQAHGRGMGLTGMSDFPGVTVRWRGILDRGEQPRPVSGLGPTVEVTGQDR